MRVFSWERTQPSKLTERVRIPSPAPKKIMKDKFKVAYMDVAKRFAELSSAERLHVGAIVVKDDRIISIGYNGMPSGWDNECEYVEFMPHDKTTEEYPLFGKFWLENHEINTHYKLVTKREVLHAESNAISKLARSTESGLGADIFITHAPCLDCAKLIYQSGIKRVFYGQQYRDDSGIKFLKQSKVEVEQIKE